MKSYLYKMECLTNLHVGSGDINFSIVDNEVEKDPTTGYPTINATGIKGAIRDYCSANGLNCINKVFGDKGDKETMNAGDFKFFAARFLYRVMRTSGSLPSVAVTTEAAVNDLLSTAGAFGCNPFGALQIKAPAFNGNNFVVNTDKIDTVEGVPTGKYDSEAVRKVLGLDTFGMARSFDNYDLPVIARNKINEKTKTSENLWYEEYVPHGSAFYLIVLTPDSYDKETMLQVIPNSSIIQFGGNASVGYGYCRMSLIGEGEC